MNEVFNTKKSILEEIRQSNIYWLNENGVQLFVKRDDLIHNLVSGNKWRKLKYNILQAKSQNKKGVLTFGGAFSNHLIATASACKEIGFKSIGIVRGDELNQNSNSILKKCFELDMQLLFVDRQTYLLRNKDEYVNELKNTYKDYFLVPEGGANFYGMVGCQEIWKEIPIDIDHVFVAQGTTTTSCGLLLGLPEKTVLHVIPVLKGFDSINEMRNLLRKNMFGQDLIEDLLFKVVVHDNYHFGGYGKYSDELLDFIQEMNQKIHIPLDFIYTGKAFFAMMSEIKKSMFKNQKVLFLHTGGLA